MPPSCQNVSSGQTGSSEVDSHQYWLSNHCLASALALLHNAAVVICVLIKKCWEARVGINVDVCGVCVWCLNKSYMSMRQSQQICSWCASKHPIKPSEPIGNLHHKDSIHSYLTAQILDSELLQCWANSRLNKERTQQNAAVCRVVTIKASAGRCVRANLTLICKLWKPQQRNMFFKTLPGNLVFSIYLLFSPRPLGLLQLWLKTNSWKLNLSIWNGPLNQASPWDGWRKRGKQLPPLICLFQQESQRWCHENCHIQMRSARPISGTKWEHPKLSICDHAQRTVLHWHKIVDNFIELWNNTNALQSSNKLLLYIINIYFK